MDKLRIVGWLAAAGTLPYLTLKVLWLAGSPVGVTDPAFLADPAIVALNAVTLGMDLLLVAVAMALTHRWGLRLPALLVLLPIWVASGFMVPMVIGAVPGLLLSGGAPAGPLAGWVQPVVYGGFAWQGVFLVIAFIGYSLRRWADVIDAPAVPVRPVPPLLAALVGGGATMAGISAVLHVASVLTGGPAVGILVSAINAALATLGAVGVVALVRGRRGRRAAVAAAWTGSAAMFAWGLWAAVNTMAATPLAGGHPVSGMAQLTGLLAGLTLATAALTTLGPTPTPPGSRTPSGADAHVGRYA